MGQVAPPSAHRGLRIKKRQFEMAGKEPRPLVVCSIVWRSADKHDVREIVAGVRIKREGRRTGPK